MKPETDMVTIENIADMIRPIRGQRVILDADLARLYGVPTSRFNEAVKRNANRFPADFMFRLTEAEWKGLISQIAISSLGHGGRRSFPYAFTEHGALMAANILKSQRAVAMSIHVIRAFIQFRQVIAEHSALARKLATLEEKYDNRFKVVFDAIRALMAPAKKPKREIGFHTVK